MTFLVSEIHRVAGDDVGFLEGTTIDDQCVYVRYKYGHLEIHIWEPSEGWHEDDAESLVFERKLADAGYHIADCELVAVTKDAGIRWPRGFGDEPLRWPKRFGE